MIATTAVIAEKKKFSDRSDDMETTFQRSLESGFLMIAELFFLSDRSDHNDRSDHMLSYTSLLNKIRFNNYNTW